MLDASELSRRLAQHAEAVCRRYLSNGRREGSYWLVGDVANTRGGSLYVRLRGGRVGRWRDAATGEGGDLLDLLSAAGGHGTLAETLAEARSFLALPQAMATPQEPSSPGSAEAARRLFAASRPIRGTLAQTYLRSRDVTAPLPRPLRYHPACWYRPREGETSERTAWPALMAAVTDLHGEITGVQRTWLDPRGGKAPVATPRRALGALHGHGVRFGRGAVMIAGEGLETVLSLRTALPKAPAIAALSAAHLAALRLPSGLRRLYVARDADDAGGRAAVRLAIRARDAGVEAIVLEPALGDFNDDLMVRGPEALRAHLCAQLRPEDVARFAA